MIIIVITIYPKENSSLWYQCDILYFQFFDKTYYVLDLAQRDIAKEITISLEVVSVILIAKETKITAKKKENNHNQNRAGTKGVVALEEAGVVLGVVQGVVQEAFLKVIVMNHLILRNSPMVAGLPIETVLRINLEVHP